MNEVDPGLAFFGVIGFITFIWGLAWVGYKIEKDIVETKIRREIQIGTRDKNYLKYFEFTMGNSLGAFIAGFVALLLAIVIRYS